MRAIVHSYFQKAGTGSLVGIFLRIFPSTRIRCSAGVCDSRERTALLRGRPPLDKVPPSSQSASSTRRRLASIPWWKKCIHRAVTKFRA
jgi:hypothetical protein